MKLYCSSIQDEGRTALLDAHANGHDGVVKLLLEYGANADLKDKVIIVVCLSSLTIHSSCYFAYGTSANFGMEHLHKLLL